MKKYIKPIVEVKEFKAADRIANLESFVTDNTDAGLSVGTDNITSYYAVS